MDAAQILDRLTCQHPLPVEALREASADRERVAPIFVNAIEQYVSPGGSRAARDSLYFVFHLLGEWREKSAYRPLARLLRCPPDDLDEILGGAITETTHRVMAAVFDGDPGPLYGVILDPEADAYIRSRMLEAIAMVTLNGEMPRPEAARFLQTCYDEINPQDECWVWNGWQSAIAWLGLVELKPLVEQAFAREFISDTWLGLHHFEEDLQQAINDPAAMLRQSNGEYSLFGNTVEEFSTWNCFGIDSAISEVLAEKLARLLPGRIESAAAIDMPVLSQRSTQLKECENIHRGTVLWQAGTAINRYKEVGRNDPCPCGSGRKFKKCCVGAMALQAM